MVNKSLDGPGRKHRTKDEFVLAVRSAVRLSNEAPSFIQQTHNKWCCEPAGTTYPQGCGSEQDSQGPCSWEFSANDSLCFWVSRRSWTSAWFGGLRGRGKQGRPPIVDVDTGTSKSRCQQTMDLETRN